MALSPAVLFFGRRLVFAQPVLLRKLTSAFFLDPPACAVGEARPHRYSGETAFPFVLQNLHRYFLYGALIFLIILWYDAIRAFWFDGSFGIGLGSIVLLVNIALLSFYTLSCHSLRHILGGNVDCFSCVALVDQAYCLAGVLFSTNITSVAWRALLGGLFRLLSDCSTGTSGPAML